MERIKNQKSKVTLSLRKPAIDLGKDLSKRSGKSLSAIAEMEIRKIMSGDLESKLSAFYKAKGIFSLKDADSLEDHRLEAINKKHAG